MLTSEIIGLLAFAAAADLNIPGWFVFLAGGFIIWMLHLTRLLYQNKATIAINESVNNQFRLTITEKMEDIKSTMMNSMKEMRDEFKEYKDEFRNLSNQIMQFFVEEIKILKNRRE